MSALELGDATQLKKLEGESEWVLLDFWAPWCSPCQMMHPIFTKTSDAFHGQVAFAKVNVDETGDLAAGFGIRAIPSLVLIRNGKTVDQVNGVQSEAQLTAWLQQHLKKEHLNNN